ncbi:hypothetical protein B7P43_G10019 [Cryptotermes secundus]|uniref:Schlafen AlbA-2 domain-containing protein n=1 Tax=Cryptotermes secundus TaxID=105785 RepID=A0A2J7QBI8_9NEOP|nr:uncharacterized protein LOC111868614 isoform X2 [Cryptotermes secundus]PNF25945.1 hypothetical protein B7P43_G10019 [Cryptotermes secundus]
MFGSNKCSTSVTGKPKHYIRNEVVAFEEDQTHEFKGHRNISVADVPPWCINASNNTSTRKAISRNLCGFLNTGCGGTVYIGILDGGRVQGVRLTRYQQDHLLLSLQDAMNAFRPPVPRFMYTTEFVPVLEPGDEYPYQFLPVSEKVRAQPHYLRSHLFCWCDYDALGSFNGGVIPMSYVVEISIIPIYRDDPWVRAFIPDCKIATNPIFQCEDGQIYFRKQSTLVTYSLRDVEQLAREEVLLYRMPQLMKAWKDMMTYRTLQQLVDEALDQKKDNSCNEDQKK